MPKKDGHLTRAEKEKVIDWLAEHGAAGSDCPACGHDRWVIGQHLVTAVAYNGDGLLLGGSTYPQVMVVCQNCYYTRHFMAVPMGITGLIEEEDERESVQEGGRDG